MDLHLVVAVVVACYQPPLNRPLPHREAAEEARPLGWMAVVVAVPHHPSRRRSSSLPDFLQAQIWRVLRQSLLFVEAQAASYPGTRMGQWKYLHSYLRHRTDNQQYFPMASWQAVA